MMTHDVFKKNLGLYGADLSRWPVQSIKPALALIEAMPQAAAAFRVAEQLDHLLRHNAPAPVFPADLAARIVRQARYVPQARVRRSWFFENIYLPGSSLVLAALLGVVVSFSGESNPAFAANSLSIVYQEQHIIQDSSDDFHE